MAKPLSDSEVVGEMRKMVAFIKQEALEKAREIKTKADEEFAIEKGKIVRQETLNIDAQYDKKRKQDEVAKKIARSNQNNVARLKVLESREGLLDQVFEGARVQISQVQQNDAKYSALLKDLILQGLFTISEKDIKVICRKKDADKVKKAAKEAVKEYGEQTGATDVEVDVLPELPKESNGGVCLVGYNDRITVDNTLEARLDILEQTSLPQIREALFGKNPNRRFET